MKNRTPRKPGTAKPSSFSRKAGRPGAKTGPRRRDDSAAAGRPEERTQSARKSRFAAPKKDSYREEKRQEKKPFPAKRPGVARIAPAPAAAPKPPRPALGHSFLWGLHAVREAWLNPARKIVSLRATEAGLDAMDPLFREAEKKGLTRPSPVHAERAELDRLLPRGAVHQGLALEVAPLPEVSLDDFLGQDEGAELIVVLDQVTDPHNVGAILRSAAALGAGALIVTERNAPGATGILAKSACGAAEHVPVIPVVNLVRALEALKAEQFWCVGLAEEGERDLAEASLASGRIALVMGAEGDGLRRLTREHCDEIARLPTGGPIGSLNVSNAAAIALYEVRRQRKMR